MALADVNTHVYGCGVMNERLTKPGWIKHGLRTLTKSGPGALKVGPMAAGLDVSRGSFYWHFSDIADFKAQVLQSWRERSTEQIIELIEAEKAEPERLRRLLRLGMSINPKLERAIRSWAAEDEDVATAVASVDGRRVAYIAKLLIAAGVGDAKAQSRATFLYWAYLGQAIVMEPRLASISEPALDDISGIFER